MVASSQKLALGILVDKLIIGRVSFFAQYGIDLVKEVPATFDQFLSLKVKFSGSRIHYFYPVEDSDVYALGEALSRAARIEVEVHCGLHTLIRWHKGQVVMGHRPLRYFEPQCSETDNNRTIMKLGQ